MLAAVARPPSNWQCECLTLTCCVHLIHELRVVVFIVFGEQTTKCKKCEMATDYSFAKNLPPKMRLFFLRLLSWQTISFLEFLAHLTPFIIMKERTNTILYVSHIKH